jgi:uncharacterized protein YvpB
MTSMSVRNFLASLLLGVFAALLAPLPVAADPIPDRATIEGIKGVAQSFSLSCESRSAVDWAAFWGVSIRERKFLSRLPRSKNPDLGFVGNPSDPWGEVPPKSYGVHAEPVAALLRDYGLQAEARRDMSWDELRTEVAAGRPVIVWVIGQIWRGTPLKYTPTGGHKTTVARFEHTMIVVGYTPATVYLVDSYTGQNQTHPLRDFLASWKTLGNMAIVGQAKAKKPPAPPKEYAVQIFLPAIIGSSITPQPQAAPTPNPPRIYVVRRGDSLIGVARGLGVNWRKLAAHNQIPFPYILYTGQALKIP